MDHDFRCLLVEVILESTALMIVSEGVVNWQYLSDL